MLESFRFEPYAILVADMIGYSRRLANHSLGTHAAFTAHLDDVFQPSVSNHTGRVIKTTGDGIIAIFAGPRPAERCAHDI